MVTEATAKPKAQRFSRKRRHAPACHHTKQQLRASDRLHQLALNAKHHPQESHRQGIGCKHEEAITVIDIQVLRILSSTISTNTGVVARVRRIHTRYAAAKIEREKRLV